MRGVSSRVLTYDFVRSVVVEYLRERASREGGSVFTVKTRHVRRFARRRFKADIKPAYIVPVLSSLRGALVEVLGLFRAHEKA